jgi:hypothetical protein
MCFLMKNGAEEEVICTVSFRILLAFGDTVGTNDPQTLFTACRGEIERAASQNTTALPESSTKFWTSADATCEPWSRPLRGGRGRSNLPQDVANSQPFGIAIRLVYFSHMLRP